MKKIIYFITLAAGCCTFENANGQMAFATKESIDINNISATVLVHGDMFWDPAIQEPACEYPKGSHRHINFTSAIWMSGYDGGGKLHLAAQTYRQDGNDYWPGPLDASDTLTYATSNNWAKIWKVNRTDIQSFLALPTHTTTNTPPMILTWPAKGNTYAAGKAGAPLSITTDMAPFADLNGNGIYEPLSGEYPAIKGDQALWWVFSDNGPAHTQTNARPLGVEVHTMAYAYSRGTLIDNLVYFEYKVFNKSPNTYNNFRFAHWSNADIGYYLDDYLGFDSAWRMGINYNGTNCDGCSAGNPVNSYGTNPPQSGITMVELPGDAGTSYVPAGSYVYHNNDGSVIGNPYSDTEYNHYIRARMRNGDHYKYDYLGPGVPCTGFGSGPDRNYVFTGDPSNNTQWSMCACNSNPGDRLTIQSSNDFTLNSGSSQRIVLALLVADSARGCGATSFNKMRIMADTAWGNYHREAVGTPEIADARTLNIYPNPAHDKLYIDHAGYISGSSSITFHNVLGQALYVPLLKNGTKYEADISSLPPGLYHVLYRSGTVQAAAKFLKQ